MKNLDFFFFIYHLSPWDSLGHVLIWADVPLLSTFEGHCNPKHVALTEQGRGGGFVPWWSTAASALLPWPPGSWKGSPSLFPASVSFLRSMGRKSGRWFPPSLCPSQLRLNPKRVFFQGCELRALVPFGNCLLGPGLLPLVFSVLILVSCSET